MSMAATTDSRDPSAIEERAVDDQDQIPSDGRSHKRPRLEEEAKKTSLCVAEDEEEDDDRGCGCANAGCPWQWGSSSSSSSSRKLGSATPMTMASVGSTSFFHGPLLSVKEYRDRRTGEVRCEERAWICQQRQSGCSGSLVC